MPNFQSVNNQQNTRYQFSPTVKFFYSGVKNLYNLKKENSIVTSVGIRWKVMVAVYLCVVHAGLNTIDSHLIMKLDMLHQIIVMMNMMIFFKNEQCVR